MKRLFFAIVSLFLLVFAGCEKEENVGMLNSPDTLVATIETAGDTKAYLKEEDGGVMNVVWQGYDPISVFYKIGDEVKNVKYVCDDGAGTTTGIFVKADNNIDVTGATLLAAVYPYTQGATYTEGTKVVSGLTMAASYEFSAQMIKTGTPMAYVGNGDRIVFKNAAALVKVTASNIPTGYTSVELSSATAKLSGNYTITFDNNGLPVAALTDENTNANTVTFTGTSENQTVYFPILPGTYTDLKVSAKGTSVEPLVLVAPKALDAARSNYYYTTVAVQSVSTQDALTNAITGSGTEDVNIAVDDNLNEVELPSTGSEKEVNLAFSSTSGDISISQADAATVAGNVNIIATNESSSPRELNITLPNSTVQVSGSSTYSNINASTAENTLVLGSGVTAQKVTVIKGNIIVNTGATLSSIALGTDVTSVIIIDNGGTIADAVKSVEGVTVVAAAQYELLKFLNGTNPSGTYTLTGDVTVPANTVIPAGVTIDGGANKYTVSTDCEVADGVGKGVFVLNGGNIKNLIFASPNTQYDVIVKAAAEIENCDFLTATAEAMGKGKRAIFTGTDNVSGTLTVTNCKFDDKVYAFNFSNPSNTMEITFTGCDMKGWLSGHGGSHKFVNCTFGKSGDYQNFIPYCASTFEGCTFEEGFMISLKHATTLTFDSNCKVGTTALTAPTQISWDGSGDGQDNGTSETVKIGTSTWVNNVAIDDENDTVDPNWLSGLLAFLNNNPSGTYTLTGDVTVPANTVIPAGVTIDGGANKYTVSTDCEVADGVGKGVFVLNGGNIKNLIFASPNTQYDVIVKAAAEIENCDFLTATAEAMGKGKRAIFTGTDNVSGTLTVTNCKFDDKVYAFNFSNPSNTMEITFTGCDMKGWLSGHGGSHKFVNCTFGKSGDYQNFIPYCASTFEGCTFEEGFMISLKHATTLTFDSNCKVGTTALTAPTQISWDGSGDGQDNGTSETVKIGTSTWVNSVAINDETDTVSPEWAEQQ